MPPYHPNRTFRTLLLTYLTPMKGQVALLAVLLASSVGLQLINPQIVRGYIDAAQEGAALPALVAAAAAFLGVAVLGQLAGLGEMFVASNVGWRATNALRADLASHCLSLDLAFHSAITPGELIERVDGDVSTLAGFFSRFVVVVLGNAVLLLGILVLVFREDLRLGLLFLAFSVASLSFSIWARRIGARYALAQRQASAELFAFLEERLGALPDVLANGVQAHVLYGAQRRLRELFRRGERSVYVSNLLGVRRLIDTAGWVATLVLVAELFRRGEITLGGAYLLVQYRTMVNQPLSQIVRQLRDLQQASASVERVQNLLSTSSRVRDHGRTALPAGPLDVVLDRVSFHYGVHDGVTNGRRNGAAASPTVAEDAADGREIAALRDVSFTVPAGRVLGLLGRTGSGKSTVSRLLVRLYDATAGSVRVGGVDVRDLALDTLRARAGLVTQEVQLFRATIRDNLTLFDPSIHDRRVAAALEDVGLGEWLRSLPMGLDTPLGGPASGLSAGQSQLLAFARVFLRDPGLVVLDEASSRLDPATERRVDGAVARLLTARTGVVIAHRLETVRRADDILILDDGAVVEHGARAELAADPGSRFAALLRAGTLEAALEAPPPAAGGAAVRRPEVPA